MDKWDKRFMELAYTVAGWSSCFQENRQIGAVIVRDKRILTTGYNGAPGNVTSCKERGECLRRRLNIPSGTRQELCYAVHAEQNAVIQPLTGWARQLPELDLPFEGHRPTAFVVICHDTDIAENAERFYKDVGITAQTMLLCATDMGYGGCMIGNFCLLYTSDAADE